VDSHKVGGSEQRNLKVRLPGTNEDLAPILLVGHAGVPTVNVGRWGRATPPFDAVVEGEHLYGRGALDMHAPLALFALTLSALARAEVAPARDVVLLVTGDGEGESVALRYALDEWPELLEADVALTEGGFVLQDGLRAGEDLVTVAWADKGRLQLALRAEGELAPPSRPRDGDAAARLARALARLAAWRAPARPPEVARRTAAALARARGGLTAILAGNDALTARWLVPDLADDPLTRPLLEHGCAIVRMGAEDLPHMLPEVAGARVECGVLPGATPAQVRDEVLLAIDDPRVRVRVVSSVRASVSPPEGPVLDVVRARFQRDGASVPVVPWVSARPTAAAALRARGVAVYGFVPLRIDRAELESAGAAQERVRTREIEDALARTVDIVHALAAREADG
jgi:acetylornithine deacetylase/succinyl-diaminopimelate desuccinylase-like protein